MVGTTDGCPALRTPRGLHSASTLQGHHQLSDVDNKKGLTNVFNHKCVPVLAVVEMSSMGWNEILSFSLATHC